MPPDTDTPVAESKTPGPPCEDPPCA
jgi:hypothetical protein